MDVDDLVFHVLTSSFLNFFVFLRIFFHDSPSPLLFVSNPPTYVKHKDTKKKFLHNKFWRIAL